MGTSYEAFLILFSLGIGMGYVAAGVKRRTMGSLYAQAVEQVSALRGLWIALDIAAVLAWFALLLLGFLMLRWYLVVGIFVGVGIALGALTAVLLFRRPVELLVGVGRVAQAATLAISLILWLQKLAN